MANEASKAVDFSENVQRYWRPYPIWTIESGYICGRPGRCSSREDLARDTCGRVHSTLLDAFLCRCRDLEACINDDFVVAQGALYFDENDSLTNVAVFGGSVEELRPRLEKYSADSAEAYETISELIEGLEEHHRETPPPPPLRYIQSSEYCSMPFHRGIFEQMKADLELRPDQYIDEATPAQRARAERVRVARLIKKGIYPPEAMNDLYEQGNLPADAEKPRRSRRSSKSRAIAA